MVLVAPKLNDEALSATATPSEAQPDLSEPTERPERDGFGSTNLLAPGYFDRRNVSGPRDASDLITTASDPSQASADTKAPVVHFGVSGTIGGSPMPILPGPFVGAGASVGFSSTFQLSLSLYVTVMTGPGIFGGAGFSSGVSYDSPEEAGSKFDWDEHTEMNVSIPDTPLEFGYALDTTTKSFDLERALPLKLGKIGAGVGAMAATGPAGTATFTSPPIPVKELYRFFLGPAPSEGRDSDTTH